MWHRHKWYVVRCDLFTVHPAAGGVILDRDNIKGYRTKLYLACRVPDCIKTKMEVRDGRWELKDFDGAIPTTRQVVRPEG